MNEINKLEKILILAPHTDDGELGCGGTIAKYIAAGKQIIYVGFSNCAASLPKDLAVDTLIMECQKATKELGILETVFFDFKVRHFFQNRQQILESMIDLRKKYSPDIVFVPAKNDVHQDHQVIYTEALRAFKFSSIIGYELPWNNWQFQPTMFEKLTEEIMNKKSLALECYASQSHRSYMNKDFILSLAKVRGMQANSAFAEAFEIYRCIQ